MQWHNLKVDVRLTGLLKARKDAGGCRAAAAALRRWRKVRTPQGREVVNDDRGRPQGKGHRKDTARRGILPVGKGEKAG